MTDDQLNALRCLRFNWAPTRDDVWQPQAFHIDGLNDRAMRVLRGGMHDARVNSTGSPIGVVLEGRKGAGKTHLLGWLRERAQRDGSYFVLVTLLTGNAFWENVLVSYSESLFRPAPDARSQLHLIVDRLLDRVDAPADIRTALRANSPIPDKVFDEVLRGIARIDRAVALESSTPARALLQCVSEHLPTAQEGEQLLTLPEVAEDDNEDDLGARERAAQLMVRRLSRLLALTGPTVLAIDQMDTLLTDSVAKLDEGDGEQHAARATRVVSHVADGLMELRESARRTFSVVACLPGTWDQLKASAVASVPDRFREEFLEMQLPSPSVARSLVERRFRLAFEQIGFTPPYPSWPVKPVAFEDAWELSPRQLLQVIDDHVNACLDEGVVRELESLKQKPAPSPAHLPPPVSDDALVALDAEYGRLRAASTVNGAYDAETEDEVLPSLLTAGLEAWVLERGTAATSFAVDPIAGSKPALHARLRLILDAETEDERHWAFRAVAARSGRSQYHRVQTAVTMSGCGEGSTRRTLIFLRNEPWTRGPKTQALLDDVRRAGGGDRRLEPDDLVTFNALREMLRRQPQGLNSWLVSRQPASRTALFGDALGRLVEQPTDVTPGFPTATAPRPTSDPSPVAALDRTNGKVTVTAEVQGPPGPLPRRRPQITTSSDTLDRHHAPVTKSAEPASTGGSIVLGTSLRRRRAVNVALEALRKHVALFAGSGSGKTVFIRRIVEECALAGVSSIVLDPNNDLARLGDAWPEPPAEWSDADRERAADYLAHTDVRIWTPGRDAGRPLSFQPLPDFAAVLDDTDELNDAIESAVAALAPRARIDGRTSRSDLSQAVLRQALSAFARDGDNHLDSFIDYLRHVPDDVHSLGVKGRKAATELADALRVATVNDKLFGGSGASADPGRLLTPPAGRRARVSVISFIGLRSEAQRQSFVNHLQMALFAWIKANPAASRPLGGLLVMDEAQTLAPSGRVTPCTYSTLALASQARKYGLGLVFATQSPKGLHNQIAGNASTQLFGHLNAPVQIATVKEMARARGDHAELDVAGLTRGQFLVGLEGRRLEKISTSMCLSHHPPSPLTDEEVLVRASSTGISNGTEA